MVDGGGDGDHDVVEMMKNATRLYTWFQQDPKLSRKGLPTFYS